MKPNKSFSPPPALLAALLSFKPRTLKKVKPAGFCALDRLALPDAAFETREARVDALPLLRCFRTVCAVFEVVFGLTEPEDLVVGRDLIALGSVGAGFLFRRAAESMSKSPSPSVRVAPAFLF